MPFLTKLRRRGFLPWCRRDASLSGAPRAGEIVLEAPPGPRRGGPRARAAAFGTHPGSRHATTGMGNTRFDRYCQGPAPLDVTGPYSEALCLTRRAPRPLAGRGPASGRVPACVRASAQAPKRSGYAAGPFGPAGTAMCTTCNGDLDVRTGGVEAIDYCPPNIMLAPVFGPQVDKSYGACYSSSLLPSTSANGASHPKSCAEASCQL